MWGTQKIPFPHTCTCSHNSSAQAPDLSPRNENVSAGWPQCQRAASSAHCWEAPAALWQVQHDRRERRQELCQSLPSVQHHLTTYSTARAAPAPAHLGAHLEAWDSPGKPQFHHWLLASAEAKSLRSSDPASPICESWGQACLPSSAVE